MNFSAAPDQAPGLLLSSDPAASAPVWPNLLAGLLLLAAAGLRMLYLALPEINADMAMWGLQAIDILEGRPHFLFGGELFGGNLEAWLAAPLFALLGPSAGVLCLAPFTFSLVMVWAVWRLASREMGPWPGLLALAWVAIPPYYLAQHSVWPLGAYIEVPCLAVLCLGLTLGLDRQLRDGEPQARTAFLLGLLWGLGLWTHLLMLPAALATGTWLLLRHSGRQITRCLPWLGLGALLGGLPLWFISIPGGLLSPTVLGQGRELQLAPAWRAFWEEGLPQVLGLLEQRRLGKAWVWVRLGVWALYGLLLLRLGLSWLAGRTSRAPRGGALLALCLLYLVTYLVVWLFSGAYSQSTWRHLTPLYAGLPFLLAAGLTGEGRLGRGLGLALGLLALGLNLWGSLAMAPWLDARQRLVYEDRRQGEQALFARLGQEGLAHVYAQWFWDALPLSLASGGKITFADQVENHLPRLSLEADRSPRPAYVLTTREVDFRHTLAAAGIKAQAKNVAQFHLYRDFARPLPALRQVPPLTWRSPQAGGQRAWDRNLSTAYAEGLPQRPGQRFTLDLGRVEPDICLVELMPGAHAEAAAGLELWTSLDGQEWRPAASQQGTAFGAMFWSLDRPLMRFLPARQQLAFSPRPARYLELRLSASSPGRWWSLAEIFVHQAAGPAQPEPTPAQLAQAISALPSQGLVYAPPQVLALLPPQRRGVIDPQFPLATSFPLERLHLRLEPSTVLCLPRHEWEACRNLLQARLFLPPLVHQVGGWVLVSDLRPLAQDLVVTPLPHLATADASHQPELASLPLRLPPGPRWHTGQPQAPGQWYQVDLGRETTIAGLSLSSGPWPQDRPLGLKVELRTEMGDWEEVQADLAMGAPLAWGGERVLLGEGPLWVTFPPQTVRALRLTQTGGHPHLHWTIAGVGLLVREPGERD